MRRRWMHLPVCLLATSQFLACASDDDRSASLSEEIVIGVIAPVASEFFRSGPPTVEGAELAAEEINQAGGVDLGSHRRQIRLIIEDTGDQPETAVSKAFKLIGTDGAVALVGLSVSKSALAVARVAQARGVPMISTTSTNPETTRGKSFVFRTIFDDSVQGRIMAEFALGELGARKAAIVSDPGSAYSRGFAAVFQKVFEHAGGEVISHLGYAASDPSFAERLEQIRGSEASVLVIPVYSALLAPLMPQVRAAGIELPVLGGDTWGANDRAERAGWSPAFFSDVWTPEVISARSQRFVESYELTYGKPASSYAALAYDAVHMLAAAIEHGGDAAPETIRAGLTSLEGFTGITGTIRYPDTGDPVRSAVIMQLAPDGSAALHQSIEPEPGTSR